MAQKLEEFDFSYDGMGCSWLEDEALLFEALLVFGKAGGLFEVMASYANLKY